MRPKRLAQRGFAHYVMPVLVVGLFAVIGGLYLSLTHADAVKCTATSYTSGASGTCTQDIQEMLNGANAGKSFSSTAPLITDGQFGPLTLAKTKAFQQWAKLANDGIVGPNTWATLCTNAGGGVPAASQNAIEKTGAAAAKSAGCPSPTVVTGSGSGTPPKGATKLISLGGSIAAGAGVGTGVTNTLTGCSRMSGASFAAIMAKDEGLQLVQAACSGATAANVLPSNLAGNKVQAGTKATEMSLVAPYVHGNVVTLFVGGNDSDWIGDIGDCFANSAQNGYPKTDASGVYWPLGCPTDATHTAEFKSSLPTLQNNVKTIVSTLNNEGAAEVIVDEYYPVATAESDVSCVPTNTAGHFHIPAQNPGIDWLQARLPELNAAIHDGALAAGGNVKVVTPNFAGHYMCAGDPWVAGPGLNDGATAHPTVDGQQYLAKLNESAL